MRRLRHGPSVKLASAIGLSVISLGCATSPARGPVSVTAAHVDGFVVARFDARGCVSDEVIEHVLAQKPWNGSFYTPTAADAQLQAELAKLSAAIDAHTGGAEAWRAPAAHEFDSRSREILVRQRPELFDGIQHAIDEVRRSRS